MNQLTCQCGKSYSYTEEQAGKRFTCPACKGAFIVPAATEPVVAEPSVADELMAAKTAGARRSFADDGFYWDRFLLVCIAFVSGVGMLVAVFGPAHDDADGSRGRAAMTACICFAIAIAGLACSRAIRGALPHQELGPEAPAVRSGRPESPERPA